MGIVGGDTGVKIAVTPVLIGANKKHLNTGLPPFDMQGDDIGLGDSARVDALGGLHLRHGANTVAQAGGFLKLHRVGRCRHLFGQCFLNLRGFPRQKPLGIAHRLGIVRFRYATHTGRGAAFDLILQTGPRARVKHTVRTITQQKHPL